MTTQNIPIFYYSVLLFYFKKFWTHFLQSVREIYILYKLKVGPKAEKSYHFSIYFYALNCTVRIYIIELWSNQVKMSTNELKNVTSFDKFSKELQEEIGLIEKDSSFKLKGSIRFYVTLFSITQRYHTWIYKTCLKNLLIIWYTLGIWLKCKAYASTTKKRQLDLDQVFFKLGTRDHLEIKYYVWLIASFDFWLFDTIILISITMLLFC